MVLGAAALMTPFAIAVPTPRLPADTLVYDRNGHLVSMLYQGENRIPIPYQQMPADVQNALVAIEDDTFWVEPAIDPVGIARAALTNLTHGHIVQGGSTLTQQLAKNLYLSDRRTWSRKLKELLITLKLSATMSKRQILQHYLNDVYFGQGAYGIEAAAETYFGIPAKKLSLDQAALLAGLVNAPSADDPVIHPQPALARRNLVLDKMAALHYITPAQSRAAQLRPLGLNPTPPTGDRAPYYTRYLVDQLKQLDPRVARTLYSGGWRIDTGMDWSVQRAAQRAVAKWLPPTRAVNGVPEPEAALVAIDPRNGDVEALVGGDNFSRTSFNRATDARRQPGSAMKYFLYTTVINKGYSTSAVKRSAPVRFPAGNGKWYVPHNFGDVYNGPLNIRRAIALSDNIVAVRWLHTVGPAAMIRVAHAMGIESPLAGNLTTALGSSGVTPFEMTRAVSTLANGGRRVTPIAVTKITDTTGRVVYHDSPNLTRVLSPQVAYVVTNLFSAPLQSGEGTAHNLAAIINRPAAAKTGTSSSQRDAWLVGYTPQLAASVWVGNDSNRPLNLTGDLAAGPIWAHFMQQALAGRPKLSFPKPPHIVTRRVCVNTGLLDNGCCSTYREVFIQGHAPTQTSPGCQSGAGSSSAGGSSGGGNGGGPPSWSSIFQSIFGTGP